MKKLVVGAVLGLGMLVATATPAMALSWYYTGYWYNGSPRVLWRPDLPRIYRHAAIGRRCQ